MGKHMKVIYQMSIKLLLGGGGPSRVLNTSIKQELQNKKIKKIINGGPDKCESLYVCPEKLIYF
jgi:hypothetical protein